MFEFKFRIKREGIRHRFTSARKLFRMLYSPEFNEDYFVNDIMENHINEVPFNTHVRHRPWSVRLVTNIPRDDIRWTALLEYFQLRFYDDAITEVSQDILSTRFVSNVRTIPEPITITLPDHASVGDVIGITQNDDSGSISINNVHGTIEYDNSNNHFRITSTNEIPLSLEKIANDLKVYFPFILNDDIPEVLQSLTVFYNTVCKKIKERSQN